MEVMGAGGRKEVKPRLILVLVGVRHGRMGGSFADGFDLLERSQRSANVGHYGKKRSIFRPAAVVRYREERHISSHILSYGAFRR